jgi:hypothetical protein
MDADVAQQPATPTGDHPGRSGRNERRCLLFSCLEAAAPISSNLYGGELAICKVELYVLLSDAPCPRTTDNSIPGRGLAA